jgi:hypothetical protein
MTKWVGKHGISGELGSFLETKILKRSQGGLVTDIAHPGFTYPDKNLLQLVLALNRFSLKETVC